MFQCVQFDVESMPHSIDHLADISQHHSILGQCQLSFLATCSAGTSTSPEPFVTAPWPSNMLHRGFHNRHWRLGIFAGFHCVLMQTPCQPVCFTAIPMSIGLLLSGFLGFKIGAVMTVSRMMFFSALISKSYVMAVPLNLQFSELSGVSFFTASVSSSSRTVPNALVLWWSQ